MSLLQLWEDVKQNEWIDYPQDGYRAAPFLVVLLLGY